MLESEYLTTEQVCRILRRSAVTVRKWRPSGRGLRWLKIEGRILYPSRELAAWLKAQPGGGRDEVTEPKE